MESSESWTKTLKPVVILGISAFIVHLIHEWHEMIEIKVCSPSSNKITFS